MKVKVNLHEAAIIYEALQAYRKEEFQVYMQEEGVSEARRQLANQRLSVIDNLLGGFTT